MQDILDLANNPCVRKTCRTILEQLCPVTGAISGLVAAVFAVLTYRAQRIIGRDKFKIIFKHGRNGSNASVSITGKGAPATIISVDLRSDGGSVNFKRMSKFLKNGTDTSYNMECSALDKIPVNVKLWFVITLSDECSYESDRFVFPEKTDLKVERWRFPLVAPCS